MYELYELWQIGCEEMTEKETGIPYDESYEEFE